MQKIIHLVLLSVLLTSCTTPHYSATHPVPVKDIHIHYSKRGNFYEVQTGDTLYSIAWELERDYQELADINQLNPPYSIHPGDRIFLHSHPHQRKVSKKSTPIKVTPTKEARHFSQPKHWIWPAQGKLVSTYSFQHKGIDIAGRYQSIIVSTATGEVVYAGHGIRGYGQLIIIKHNATYLSAYAYNQALLVHEGQWVKQGQPIAKMGKMTNGLPRLHFEIRVAGKAINPLKMLA